ncbi:MAG: Baseplate family protein [Myxococcaceae bacterium]|nr:Baseplate family protein [Myxococcaceae bacterium]
MAGLTASGFTAKTASEILTDVEAAQKAALGADLDVSPEQPLGQINGILAAKLREEWEVMQALYAARDPRYATGAALDGVAAITGTTRRGPRAGSVRLGLTIAGGATVPAGSRAAAPGSPLVEWRTVASVTNQGADTAVFEVLAEQVVPGTLANPAAIVSTIMTPVTGWTAVTSLAPALPGAPAETDPQLRRRREQELHGAGASTLGAMEAALLRVPLVTDVTVFENPGDRHDLDGRPPHSIEALVLGGDDGAVALALWQAKAAGIQSWGNTPMVVADVAGKNRSVRFSRPIDRAVYVSATVVVDSASGLSDAAIKAAILAEFAGLKIGADVRRAALERAALNLAGITDVLALKIGTTAPGVSSANVSVGPQERAVSDAGRIEVNRA